MTRTFTDKPCALGKHDEPSSNTDFQYEIKVPGMDGAVNSTVNLTNSPGGVTGTGMRCTSGFRFSEILSLSPDSLYTS